MKIRVRILLAAVLFGLGLAACGPAGAADSSAGLVYHLNDDGTTVSVVDYEGDHAHVFIPGSHEGRPVTAIAARAFAGRTGVRSIAIPKSVVRIGPGAFYHCAGLDYVAYEGKGAAWESMGLQRYRANAIFYDLPYLTSVSCLAYPASLSYVRDGTFEYALTDKNEILGLRCLREGFGGLDRLEEEFPGKKIVSLAPFAFTGNGNVDLFRLPAGVTSINGSCSDGTINVLVLPASISYVEYYAFEKVYHACFGGSRPAWKKAASYPDLPPWEENTLFTYECAPAAPTGLQEIATGKYHGYMLGDEIIVLNYRGPREEAPADPSLDFPGKRIRSLSSFSFQNCAALTTFRFPADVTAAGKYAFQGCAGLHEVDFPDGLEEVGDCAFLQCVSLAEARMPASVSRLGPCAFEGCSALVEAPLPGSLDDLGLEAFAGCSSLRSISIPDGVRTIGDKTFSDCRALKSAEIGDGVTSIGNEAFGYCVSLVSLGIGKSVEAIGPFAFRGCSLLRGVRFPDGLKTIGPSAFNSCAIEKVVMPDSVERIEVGAFRGNQRLSSVVLGTGLTFLDAGAFAEAAPELIVYYRGTAEDWARKVKCVPGEYRLAFYSAEEPTEAGDYWHYVDGEPALWPPLP